MVATRIRPYNGWSRNNFPISMEGVTIYLPMWQEDMQSTTLRSYDQTRSTWTVTGSTVGYQGRTMDGDDVLTGPNLSTISAMSVGTGSMMLWMKPTGDAASVLTDPATLPGSGDNSGYVGISRGIRTTPEPDEDRIWVYGYDNAYSMVGLTYTVTQWYCVGWVHSGGTLYGYLYDPLTGLVSSGSDATLGNLGAINTTMQLGKTFSGFFTGTIGEFWMFSDALTQARFANYAQITSWRYAS